MGGCGHEGYGMEAVQTCDENGVSNVQASYKHEDNVLPANTKTCTTKDLSLSKLAFTNKEHQIGITLFTSNSLSGVRLRTATN